MLKKIYIAKYHGFCMGVKRAIQIVEETALQSDEPVTILNEIVHNEVVIEELRRKGVGQATSIDDVPGGTLIIPAHGVSPEIKEQARDKGLKIIDATCSLVIRIYDIIEDIVSQGYHVIHIGDPNHDETRGIVGHAPDYITVVASKEELHGLPEWQGRKLGLTFQTTYHIGELANVEKIAKEKWPQIEIFNTICNATSQRQSAVLELAKDVDIILVVGSTTSANSKRLAKIANSSCGKGFLINSADDIQIEWFSGDAEVEVVGISAGASTPQFLVEAVIERLLEISGGSAEIIRPIEKIAGNSHTANEME